MKTTLRFFLMLFFCQVMQAKAQDIPAKIKQAKWVKIMNADSLYNYFEAEAEFQKFYTVYLKEKKKEERKREKSNAASHEEEHLDSPVDLLVSEYFKWNVAIKPFVLANGSIMPLTQRLAIIREIRNKQQAQQ